MFVDVSTILSKAFAAGLAHAARRVTQRSDEYAAFSSYAVAYRWVAVVLQRGQP